MQVPNGGEIEEGAGGSGFSLFSFLSHSRNGHYWTLRDALTWLMSLSWVVTDKLLATSDVSLHISYMQHPPQSRGQPYPTIGSLSSRLNNKEASFEAIQSASP